MEYLNKAANICRDFFQSFPKLLLPYKHITIESVNDDADIENQYEKVSKKIVVGLGNVFINILIMKVDFIKYLIVL